MLAFLLTPIGRWVASIIGVIALLVGLYAGFRWWLHEHDKALLSGYVLQSEKTAAEAKAAEMERQLNVTSQILTEYQKRKQAEDILDQQKQDQSEQEIADYEKKLADAKRSCVLDSFDIDFLHKH